MNGDKIFAKNIDRELCIIDSKTYEIVSIHLIPKVSDDKELILKMMKQISREIIVLGGFKKEEQENKNDKSLFKTVLIVLYGNFEGDFTLEKTNEFYLNETLSLENSKLPILRFEFLKEKSILSVFILFKIEIFYSVLMVNQK